MNSFLCFVFFSSEKKRFLSFKQFNQHFKKYSGANFSLQHIFVKKTSKKIFFSI